MIPLFKTLVTLISMGLLLHSGTAVHADPIRVAVDSAYPPYMYGSRPAKGLYPEIIREAFSLTGLTAEVTGYPWKRALSLGRSGQTAVGGIYQNLERLNRYDYSDPLYLETLVVCVKKGDAFDFKGVVDLEGKRVGINRGWSYGEVIDSARRAGLFLAEEATGDQANLKKLILGRLDCIIADKLSLLLILQRNDWGHQVEILSHPATVNSAYLVMAKKTNQTHLIEAFNRGLAVMRANGSYGRLVDRFIRRAAAD